MMTTLSAIKILLPFLVAFGLGFLIAPIVIKQLHKFRVWKKKSGNSKGLGDDNGTPIFNSLHKEKEVNTPRMGGLVIVFAVVLTTMFFWMVSYSVSGDPSGKFDFLSRSQTWLPIIAFLAGGIIGFFDDIYQIKTSGKYAGGLPFKLRFLPTLLFATAASLWFYTKLDVSSVLIPFYGFLELGILFIPFFIAVFIAVFSTSNIDGLDGLSGGIMAIIFGAMTFIAFTQNQVDIAAFCLVVAGAILAFLWFNIPPAKFYMTEAGYNALSFTLVIIAFLTDTVLLLPIIAFMLFITMVTTIMQVGSKKFRGKKIFLVAPIHHHFEAIGWPAYKVVMRYWIVSVLMASFGVILALIS